MSERAGLGLYSAYLPIGENIVPKTSGFDPTEIRGPKPPALLGTMRRQIGFLSDPVGAILAAKQFGGDLVTLVDRDPAFIFVFGEALNQEVLSQPAAYRHDESFVEGPPGTPFQTMAIGLIAQNGDVHKRHRRLMAPAFARSALEGYAETIVDVADRLVDRWPSQGVVDVSRLVKDLALTVGVTCIYGVDIDDRRARSLGRITSRFLNIQTSPARIFSPNLNFPGTPYRRSLLLARRLISALELLIAQKRETSLGGLISRDALGLLIEATDEDGGLSKEALIGQAVTLFIAGHESTASTLAHTLFLLDRHPEILIDLEQELQTVLEGRLPTVTDLPRLTLLDQVVRESLRVLAPVPLLFLRVAPGSTELGGHALPHGANLVLSPLATHHDQRIFDEPNRFIPGRWKEVKPGPYAYLPFGAGPRTCLGRAFAEQSVRLLLAVILQRRRFRTRRRAQLSRLTRGNIMHFRHGLPMTVSTPNGPSLEAPTPVSGDIHDLVTW